MTSRERIRAAFAHQPVDRTPWFEYVLLSPVADQILGRPYAVEEPVFRAVEAEKGWEAAVRQSVCDRLELARILGHDMMYVYGTPWPVPRPGSAPAPAAPAAAEPDDPVERVARRNAHAAASAGKPVHEARFFTFVVLRDEMRRLDMDLPVLAPAYAHGVWTDVDLMQTMVLAPDVAHEHFHHATASALTSIHAYLSLGIEMIGIGGDFAGNRPLISPAAYHEFMLPELRQLSQRIHAAGALAVNASDGNLWSVLDDFLLKTEVDGYLEIDLHAGMDLERLKAAYGARITFLGNMDCGNTLSFASPAEIRQATRLCLEQGAGRAGGHIFCASNAITASVPPANYLAMAQAYRDWCGLPALKLKG